MIRVFRLFTATTALGALTLQFWLMTKYPGAPSIGVTIAHFLSFFTIQTNVLIVLLMLLPALAPSSRVSHLLSRPSVRTAVASYSAVTAIIYLLLLRNIGQDYGLERLADWILHYVTPTMAIIDWLVCVPKGQLRWRHCVRILIYPALYCASTFLYSAATGWYPYPFFNARLGHGQLVRNSVAVVGLVVALPLLFLILDRALRPDKAREGKT